MMNVGATSLGWGRTSLPQVFERLRAMGGECVELNSQKGLHAGLILDDSAIPKVRSWAADAGITIGSVGGYNDFACTDPAALDDEVSLLLGACRIASELDVPIVRAFVGEPKPGLALPNVRPYIIEAFRRASKQAEALGVKLAIENHGQLLNDGKELAEMVREIDAPNVGVTLDTGNFSSDGHDPAQTRSDFQAVLPYAISVHVKDGVWAGEDFEFVPAGEGDLDLRGLMQQLAGEGYEGPIYSEYEGSGDFETGTGRSIAYLRELVGLSRR